MTDISATKTLYCIRHGESTYNEWRLRSLWSFSWMWVRDPMIVDAPLSTMGHKQVAKLHELIQSTHLDKKIQVIITSPLTRAIETAIGVFPATNVPIIVDPLCREMLDTACDVGRVPTELAQHFVAQQDIDFSKLNSTWWLNDGAGGPSNASRATIVAPKTPNEVLPLRESQEDLDARIRDFVTKLEERPEQHIAVVGHSSYFKRMLGMNRKLHNCELYEVSFAQIRLRCA
ncbi:uncharacterized protein CCR75_007032 [Bremia lactucae]|uniref:Phosphoglycerate mutase n=1 Tax=Bremia lactucae TaxID=4779 RepID=A0A976IKU2_BRELC|nr:hypothetical protein CCR75_007032 [Bremia lactucae]